MASVGSITWQSEKDEFLKDSEVSDVVTSLEEGGLNELEGEFSSKLKSSLRGLNGTSCKHKVLNL